MTHHSRRHAPLILLAVVLLLVGTAGGAAAAKLITGKDVKNNSLTGKDVKDRSLGIKELSASARAALKGAAGAPGTPGVSGYENVVAQSGNVTSGGNSPIVRAYCPRGKKALGGGAYWVGFNASSWIASSGPIRALYAPDGTPTGADIATSTDASGWAANGRNESVAATPLFVWVTCANVA